LSDDFYSKVPQEIVHAHSGREQIQQQQILYRNEGGMEHPL